MTTHATNGGQLFQDAQNRTLSRRTRLMTITVGGNDIGLVRDMYLLAARRSANALGGTVRAVWNGPPSVDKRNYEGLRGELTIGIAQNCRPIDPAFRFRDRDINSGLAPGFILPILPYGLRLMILGK